MRIKFDAMMSHDITYVGIIQTARASGLDKFPIPYAMTNCHNSLCAVGGTINEDDHVFGLSAAKKYGGIYVPANQAVIHQYAREAMVKCGNMILGSDSHTRYGSLGTMGVGEGGGELVKQLLSNTWDINAPEVVLIWLEGAPRKGVGPHDVAISLVKAVFESGFVKNKVLEFAGPGVKNLPIDFRNGIDIMTTETTCLSSIWITDDEVKHHYDIHRRPEDFKELKPGDVAYYDAVIKVDLSTQESMIALPFHPSNAYTIHELQADPERILREVEEDTRKRFGDKIILKDFNYIFARYERLGIIGHNGVGKSTFIKMLQGIVPQDSGVWNVGETVRFGYYSQEGINFDESKRVIDAITEIADDIVVNDGVRYTPMQFLTHFLFSPADQQKYIHTLSGGEKARLHLAAVLMRSPNFLILDEPTNDLDIVTLGLLEDYLSKFKGCLIVISHDRFFLDSIVDHIFVLEGDGEVRDFPGSYSDYRHWLDERHTDVQETKVPAVQETSRPKRERDANKMTFKERREFEELTKEIDSLNAEKASLDALFNSGEQIDDILTKSSRYEEIKSLLDEKEMRWLELSEKS